MAVFGVVLERQGGAAPGVNGRCDVGCRPSVCNRGVSMQQTHARLTLVRTTPTIAALAFGITLHPAGGTVQQHAVMRQAKDFDHTVRADTINH